MNSDVPFIITVKASNIYDDNDKYNLINNLKNKELINYIFLMILMKIVEAILFKTNIINKDKIKVLKYVTFVMKEMH